MHLQQFIRNRLRKELSRSVGGVNPRGKQETTDSSGEEVEEKASHLVGDHESEVQVAGGKNKIVNVSGI
jgi:hypothetical protein